MCAIQYVCREFHDDETLLNVQIGPCFTANTVFFSSIKNIIPNLEQIRYS